MTSRAVVYSLRSNRLLRRSLYRRRLRFLDSVVYYGGAINGRRPTGHLPVPHKLIKHHSFGRGVERSIFHSSRSAIALETEFNLDLVSEGLLENRVHEANVKNLITALQEDAMNAFQYLVHHYAPSFMEVVELTVVLTGDDHMRDLNTRHFSFDHSTDVLCFPLDDAAGDAGFPVVVLGDIVLSVDTAERQAQALGHDLVTECRVLVVHALLRLLGYDHERSDREWTEVAEIEKEVLKELEWTGHGVIADVRRLMVLEAQERSPSKSRNDHCEKIDHDKRIRRGLNFAPGHDHYPLKKASQTEHPSMTSLSTGIRIVELALDGSSSTESNQGHKRKIEEDTEKCNHDIRMVLETDETCWKARKTCSQTSAEKVFSSLSSEIFLQSLELLKPTDKKLEDQNSDLDSSTLKDSTKKDKSVKEAKLEVAEIEGFEIDHLLEKAVLTTSSDSKRPGSRTPVAEILTPLLTQKSTSVEATSESFPDTFKNSMNLNYLFQTLEEANSETVPVFGNKINDPETMQIASEDEDCSSQGLDR